MRVTVVCSDSRHPIYPLLERWVDRSTAQANLVTKISEVQSGDILFLISCSELVKREVRDRFTKTLVIHASDLPKGRGWSPHIWQILEGRREIVVTLLEAEDKVDSGAIWGQRTLDVHPGDLAEHFNEKLFSAELELMTFAVEQFATVKPQAQRDEEPTYYPKRTPEDSRIDPAASLESQFDKIRVSDPVRFPAFFDLHGYRYEIRLVRKDLTLED